MFSLIITSVLYIFTTMPANSSFNSRATFNFLDMAYMTITNNNGLNGEPVPSVPWPCWFCSRKGIRPVKNWVVRCWHGYLSGLSAELHRAQLMPLPLTVSCFSKIQIGFTFLVPAYPGNPGKGPLNGCVCWWRTLVHTHFYLEKFTITINCSDNCFCTCVHHRQY